MSSKDQIELTLDSKRLISAGILLGIIVIVTYTYIVALFAFDAPSRDFPLRVAQVETLNSSNVLQSTFSAGTTVRFNSTVEKALRYLNMPFNYLYYDFVGETDYRIIVAVMDSGDKPVFFQSVQDTVSVAELQSNILNYNIASGAASGTYTYTVMVWTDWLPSGRASALTALEGTFSVS